MAISQEDPTWSALEALLRQLARETDAVNAIVAAGGEIELARERDDPAFYAVSFAGIYGVAGAVGTTRLARLARGGSVQEPDAR